MKLIEWNTKDQYLGSCLAKVVPVLQKALVLSLMVVVSMEFTAQSGAVAQSAAGDFLQIDPNNRKRLLYRGQEIRLKGANLELNALNADSIWLNFDRNYLRGLLDQAQIMGINTIRLTFPDQNPNNPRTWSEQDLQHLDQLLDDLQSRGMGAIVTLFNRHHYSTDSISLSWGYNWIDRIMNYAGQNSRTPLKNDPRVLMWDIANEPATPDTHKLPIDWLRAMRNYIASQNPSQPITIGFVNHYDVRVVHDNDPGNQIIRSSDVVSIHCYGRYAGDYPPRLVNGLADGVNYRDSTWCGGSLLAVATSGYYPNQPILLEEFGWPDRASRDWPPGHPWNLQDFPTNPTCMADMYNQVLNTAINGADAVGAIQWTLQDADSGHYFGLLDSNQQPKTTPPSGSTCNPNTGLIQGSSVPNKSAYEIFRDWNGSRPAGNGPLVQPFFRVPAVFLDTSTRLDTIPWESDDWDMGRGKAYCAPGQKLNGLSQVPGGPGRTALCVGTDSRFTGQNRLLLTLDAGGNRRAFRTAEGSPDADWAPGYFKLECGDNEYVNGVSQNALQGDNRFHAITCAAITTAGSGGSYVRVFDAGDNLGEALSTDWDPNAFKGQCANNEYVVGVSVSPNTGAPHSLLCSRS